jgi:malate dehydrogenase (oxaloacetate-decarboxylating)(NADP+)
MQVMSDNNKTASQQNVESSRRGIDILHNPRFNKGTAFTEAERDALNIRGLLPPRVFTQKEQQARVLGNFRRKNSDLEKYIFMVALQDRNECLYYRTVIDNLAEMLPIIYTPTVGEACRLFGHIFRRPRGLYVSSAERGRVRQLLQNWPAKEVAVVVVTDGERILGLGDLGAHGMGIPIGKLALYTACAGIHPSLCLPVMLDVGTNNETLLADSLYTGLPQRRLRGPDYDSLVDEFLMAVYEKYPGVLVQFEDFATDNALRLLERYRERICTFNDDIQGTAAVVLAGLFSACRIVGRPLKSQKILFYGAGAAASGIANLIVSAMQAEGLSLAQSRSNCWFVDSKGLVVKSRRDLAEHKKPYAHDRPLVASLSEVIEALRPTALIGVSAQQNAFTDAVLRKLAKVNERPIVFALSNPTSKSECTAEQAYAATDGRSVFAAGSPFAPVTYRGRIYVPGQANNSCIFPGLGLGVMAAGARRVTDAMFDAAARTLAATVSEESLQQGLIYPPLASIREVSLGIAVAVAAVAWESALATKPRPKDAISYVRSLMYEPEYPSYVQH